ncbi:MAG TPA: hypothetical protein VMR62_31850 [Bryobacteraceae bacterium]|jgi:hypothetical protein|nr:hypothetical protein [Bryobacteraceae bacterium]
MGQALLVDVDLDRGAEILRILDEAGLEVSVALWAVLGEYNDWRLLIASRQLDGSQLEAYGLVNDALRAAGFPMGKRPSIVILPMTDPTVRALRRYFRNNKDAEGERIGGQQLGNRWVEDGYIYRVK